MKLAIKVIGLFGAADDRSGVRGQRMDKDRKRHDPTWNLHLDGQRKLRRRHLFARRVGDWPERSHRFSFRQHLSCGRAQLCLQSHDDRALWRQRKPNGLALAMVITGQIRPAVGEGLSWV